MTKSKKIIAQEYFLSLDQSESWKYRLSRTIDQMKAEFPKGQTERVVYQYIKECLSEDEIPSGRSESLRDAVSAKIGGLRKDYERFAGLYREQYSGKKLVIKVIACGDLYSSGHSYDKNMNFHNANYFRNANKYISPSITLPDHQIRVDDALLNTDRIDFSSSGTINFREIFPYFDKSFLEHPISAIELADIAGDMLSVEERDLLLNSCKEGRSFPEAISWLSGKLNDDQQSKLRREQAEIHREIEKNTAISHSWWERLIGIIFVVGMAASISYCVGSSDPDAGKTKLERDTERLCDAVGGCIDD